jgi:hypothetical protein
MSILVSNLTRKEQVFQVLKDHLGLWVDGTLLANEEVGGSEGLKRLRELRQDLLRERSTYLIQQRKHPDPRRSIYQYRLVEQTSSFTPQGQPAWAPRQQEVPRAVPTPQPAAAGGDRSPRAVDSSPHRGFWQQEPTNETAAHDWKPAKKAPGTLEHVFWIGKQRVIGGIAPTGPDRWNWGVIVPANKARNTPERRAGHGVQLDKTAAIAAVEHCIREMRESGEYR